MKRKYSNKYLGKYAEKKQLQEVKEQCEKTTKKVPENLLAAAIACATAISCISDYNKGVK